MSEIDRSCNERLARIIPAIAKQENVTEALNAVNQMEWVRRMNSIRNRAEEIVLTELVYAWQTARYRLCADGGQFVLSVGILVLQRHLPDDFIQINAGHTIAEPKDYLFPETM